MAITTLFGANNILKTATLTASDDSANVDNTWSNWLTDFWEPVTGSTLVIDYGSAVSVDYWGIKASGLTAITLAWSDDDISYTTIETLNPTTDAVIFSTFTSVSHRYYKVTVTGANLKLARISVGAKVAPSGVLATPFTAPKHAHKRQLLSNRSEGGLPINNVIKYNDIPLTMNFRTVTVAWIDANWDALYDDIHDDLFFVMWDSAGRPTETALCWLTDDVNPTWSDVVFMRYTLKVKCVL